MLVCCGFHPCFVFYLQHCQEIPLNTTSLLALSVDPETTCDIINRRISMAEHDDIVIAHLFEMHGSLLGSLPILRVQSRTVARRPLEMVVSTRPACPFWRIRGFNIEFASPPSPLPARAFWHDACRFTGAEAYPVRGAGSARLTSWPAWKNRSISDEQVQVCIAKDVLTAFDIPYLGIKQLDWQRSTYCLFYCCRFIPEFLIKMTTTTAVKRSSAAPGSLLPYLNSVAV